MYCALKSVLSTQSQSKDLVENLNKEEKEKLQMFGKYTLLILKKKGVLEEFNDPLDAGKSKR